MTHKATHDWLSPKQVAVLKVGRRSAKSEGVRMTSSGKTFKDRGLLILTFVFFYVKKKRKGKMKRRDEGGGGRGRRRRGVGR